MRGTTRAARRAAAAHTHKAKQGRAGVGRGHVAVVHAAVRGVGRGARIGQPLGAPPRQPGLAAAALLPHVLRPLADQLAAGRGGARQQVQDGARALLPRPPRLQHRAKARQQGVAGAKGGRAAVDEHHNERRGSVGRQRRQQRQLPAGEVQRVPVRPLPAAGQRVPHGNDGVVCRLRGGHGGGDEVQARVPVNGAARGHAVGQAREGGVELRGQQRH